jgi:hypothetical protein
MPSVPVRRADDECAQESAAYPSDKEAHRERRRCHAPNLNARSSPPPYGKGKACVRFDDGDEAIVDGSRVDR